jgi:hypothetical protein
MRPFKDQFEDYKLNVSGLSSLAEESFMFWFKNFVNQKGQFNPQNFLPGKFYSFEYNDVLEKNKKFINKRPVIFFTGFMNYENKQAFSGMDIILMPPIFRLAFFSRIQSVYQDLIEANMKKIENGEGRGQAPLKTDYETLDIIMKGIPYKNTYRVWDLKKVRDIVEIPYEDWTRIVYLHTRSIQGTPIEEIYTKNSKI